MEWSENWIERLCNGCEKGWAVGLIDDNFGDKFRFLPVYEIILTCQGGFVNVSCMCLLPIFFY